MTHLKWIAKWRRIWRAERALPVQDFPKARRCGCDAAPDIAPSQRRYLKQFT